MATPAGASALVDLRAQADAWRAALATLGPDQSQRDRDARKHAAAALVAGVATVEALARG
jgi:thiamine biosynthesis lipoprotein ApbE